MKILVVDDQSHVRNVCESVLNSHGFEPVLAEDGLGGIEIFNGLHAEIALVLLDVSMPKMSGIEAARCIKSIDPHAEILLMTGYTAGVIIPEDLLSVCSTLQKPFTSKQLLESVHSCLNRRPGAYHDHLASRVPDKASFAVAGGRSTLNPQSQD